MATSPLLEELLRGAGRPLPVAPMQPARRNDFGAPDWMASLTNTQPDGLGAFDRDAYGNEPYHAMPRYHKAPRPSIPLPTEQPVYNYDPADYPELEQSLREIDVQAIPGSDKRSAVGRRADAYADNPYGLTIEQAEGGGNTHIGGDWRKPITEAERIPLIAAMMESRRALRNPTSTMNSERFAGMAPLSAAEEEPAWRGFVDHDPDATARAARVAVAKHNDPNSTVSVIPGPDGQPVGLRGHRTDAGDAALNDPARLQLQNDTRFRLAAERMARQRSVEEGARSKRIQREARMGGSYIDPVSAGAVAEHEMLGGEMSPLVAGIKGGPMAAQQQAALLGNREQILGDQAMQEDKQQHELNMQKGQFDLEQKAQRQQAFAQGMVAAGNDPQKILGVQIQYGDDPFAIASSLAATMVGSGGWFGSEPTFAQFKARAEGILRSRGLPFDEQTIANAWSAAGGAPSILPAPVPGGAAPAAPRSSSIGGKPPTLGGILPEVEVRIPLPTRKPDPRERTSGSMSRGWSQQ